MNIRITKKELDEIINTDGSLIGKSGTPQAGSDLESQANNTTDNNSKMGNQPFRYDMLGRFGFTLMPFFEGKFNDDIENIPVLKELAKLMYDKYMETLEYYYRNPNKLKSDFRINSEIDFETQDKEKQDSEYKWVKKIIETIYPFIEDEKKPVDENKIIEDKMLDQKSSNKMIKKSDAGDIKDVKLKKVVGLINKLDKNDINKIINLLEKNNVK